MTEVKDITLQEVLAWIVQNDETSDEVLDAILTWVIRNKRNTDAMDKINVATYPYTGKFLARRAAEKAQRQNSNPNNENPQA